MDVDSFNVHSHFFAHGFVMHHALLLRCSIHFSLWWMFMGGRGIPCKRSSFIKQLDQNFIFCFPQSARVYLLRVVFYHLLLNSFPYIQSSKFLFHDISNCLKWFCNLPLNSVTQLIETGWLLHLHLLTLWEQCSQKELHIGDVFILALCLPFYWCKWIFSMYAQLQ